MFERKILTKMYTDLKCDLRFKLDNYMGVSFQESTPELIRNMINGKSLTDHNNKEYISLAVSVQNVLAYGKKSMKNRWKIKKLIREIDLAFTRIVGHYSWLHQQFPYLRYDEMAIIESLRHHAILNL